MISFSLGSRAHSYKKYDTNNYSKNNHLVFLFSQEPITDTNGKNPSPRYLNTAIEEQTSKSVIPQQDSVSIETNEQESAKISVRDLVKRFSRQ